MSALPRYGRYVGAAALRRIARDRRNAREAAQVPGLPDPAPSERVREIDERIARLDSQRIAAIHEGDIAEANQCAAEIAALKRQREG